MPKKIQIIGTINNNMQNAPIDTTLTKDGQAADAKVVGDSLNEIRKNIADILVDDAEQLAMLVNLDMLPSVYNSNGAIVTDEHNNVILRY